MRSPLLPALALAVLLFPVEETDPKGFETPSRRKAQLVDIKKVDWNRAIEGDETESRTYLEEASGKRFRTYELQNNVFRYDLGVDGDEAETTLLDRDGDGRFEARLPFGEAKGVLPEWILEVLMSPQKILNRNRVAVVRDAERFQRAAIQRGRAGAARPVIALFFEETAEPPGKEAQFHPSVASALMLSKLREEFEERAHYIGYRFEARPDKELKVQIALMNKLVGTKVRKLPTFVILEVLEGTDKRTGEKVFQLKPKTTLSHDISLREEMGPFQEKLKKSAESVIRKFEKD